MSKPKYKIVQDNQGARSLWFVKRGNKVLSHHATKAEAEESVQGLVEDDTWRAANRD